MRQCQGLITLPLSSKVSIHISLGNNLQQLFSHCNSYELHGVHIDVQYHQPYMLKGNVTLCVSNFSAVYSLTSLVKKDFLYVNNASSERELTYAYADVLLYVCSCVFCRDCNGLSPRSHD
jgi:hypothetical protein